ncbi:LysR family transcriptional regulator [Hoeflea sp. YIM 152468]|uniref:LysR family transcriptional regulator n=1 Tax=Hoeflea sp. YIM 152468 TaxID=3031759 RepID=UPI0023DC969F|nr:LysR family transcriptional regulator [Hoeflea sp. YIM 152468]MDF1610168.1 LysR family transcriptional regulator [Hoeflea sp. YIM 152468]
MRTPPLNALRTFEAAARLGSFKAAADSLFVTQSAVSHQIRAVEVWLGAPLFEREGNRTRLLPHGVELARALRQSLTEIEAACHRALANNTPRPLVIAAIPSVAMCWLIPKLGLFRTAFPEIETRIVYVMHGRDINFHDVHLAFVFSSASPDIANVESAFFLGGESVPVCSPLLLNSLGHQPENADDFLRLGLLHDGDTTGWQNWFLQSGYTAQADLEGATFEDFNLLRAAALSGQGVAICPIKMVRSDIESGSLVQLSGETVDGGSNYYLLSVMSTDERISEQVRVFKNWAMAER